MNNVVLFVFRVKQTAILTITMRGRSSLTTSSTFTDAAQIFKQTWIHSNIIKYIHIFSLLTQKTVFNCLFQSYLSENCKRKQKSYRRISPSAAASQSQTWNKSSKLNSGNFSVTHNYSKMHSIKQKDKSVMRNDRSHCFMSTEYLWFCSPGRSFTFLWCLDLNFEKEELVWVGFFIP